MLPPFRWGNRRANGYQCLAEDGYALLAERLRSGEERAVVRDILQKVFRVTLRPDDVYAADAAAAAAQLASRLAEEPGHEFAVRGPWFLDLVGGSRFFPFFILCLAPLCFGRPAPLLPARAAPPRREDDATKGSEFSACGELPELQK